MTQVTQRTLSIFERYPSLPVYGYGTPNNSMTLYPYFPLEYYFADISRLDLHIWKEVAAASSRAAKQGWQCDHPRPRAQT